MKDMFLNNLIINFIQSFGVILETKSTVVCSVSSFGCKFAMNQHKKHINTTFHRKTKIIYIWRVMCLVDTLFIDVWNRSKNNDFC